MSPIFKISKRKIDILFARGQFCAHIPISTLTSSAAKFCLKQLKSSFQMLDENYLLSS